MRLKAEAIKIWKLLTRRIHDKYRFVVLNENTLEGKLSFKLSRINIFVILGLLSIGLVFITTYIIAFTSLKFYIPGYTDASLQRKIYELELRSDSITRVMMYKEKQFENLKMVLTGEFPVEREKIAPSDSLETAKYRAIQDKRSLEDSLMRAEYESQSKYNLFNTEKAASASQSGMRNFTFFSPIKGIASSDFDPLKRHFGIDLVASRDEAVKSIQDGTVIFAGWTVETGYVIAIQHPGNIVSVYKHNSVLLKKEGNVVQAGETISIIGGTGELSTGPHLHLEIWINGAPVNPRDYIVF